MNSYQIDRQKWQALSIFEQMGNIYSEIGRTLAAKQRGETEAATAAAVRALDLLDATSEGLAVERSPRLSEVLRAREVFAGAFLRARPDDAAQNLDAYFLPFAIAARLRRAA